jgi:hypothetical protein
MNGLLNPIGLKLDEKMTTAKLHNGLAAAGECTHTNFLRVERSTASFVLVPHNLESKDQP